MKSNTTESRGPVEKIEEDFAPSWAEIVRLNLETNVAELDAVGYTVIHADKVARPDLTERLRESIRAEFKRRYDHDLEMDAEKVEALGNTPVETLYFMLFKDPAFQEAFLNPMALALAEYLLGRSCVITGCYGLIKGPDGNAGGLHPDNQAINIPAPFPAYEMVINCTWLLTDYSRDAGALCFVPGTHKLGRVPNPGEGDDRRVAIDAPKGSLVLWGGRMWHGSFDRRIPGVRMAMVAGYCRSCIIPQERYREEVTPEILANNPPRFAELLGKNVYQYSFKEEGVDYDKIAHMPGGSLYK